MSSARAYRRVTFGRKLDVKRLKAALARTMREAMKTPRPGAAPARVESVLMEARETTVFLSGSGPGLDAVAAALGSSYPDARVAEATLADARRSPGRAASSARGEPGKRVRR